MEVTYTDGRWKDVGVIRNMTFDADYGDESNSFLLTIPASLGVRLEYGCLIYVEGTEYGGRYTRPGGRTENSELVYGGPTWHGILDGRTICPATDADYVTLSGDANQVIGTILSMVDTGGLFVASPVPAGVNVTVQIRYASAWTTIRRALDPAGLKPRFRYEEGHVVVSAVPWVVEESDAVSAEFSDDLNPVNHLICLGKGTLRNRTRIDLFADRDGNVSSKQTIFGIDYNDKVYDYPNAEDEELAKSGIENLQDLQENGSSSITDDFVYLEDKYDLGDRLHNMDDLTGIESTIVIGQKTVTIDNKGDLTVSYNPRNGKDIQATA